MGKRLVEQASKKLAMAVRMIAEGSKFLGRTCADCLTFQWSDDGIEGIGKNSRKKYRSLQACHDAGAKPTKRVKGTMPPCFECPKVREGAPVKSYYFADEISDQTWQTIQHFDECDAVHHFPDDSIVKKNASLIRRVRDDVKRAEHKKSVIDLLSILSVGRG
jgi:hypothetical protein